MAPYEILSPVKKHLSKTITCSLTQNIHLKKMYPPKQDQQSKISIILSINIDNKMANHNDVFYHGQ